ncbi:hypothetical protein LPTSP3_g18230 [Leptospira kobayashii]|uniref:Lipoprotein n=1 Tax=Leptospira kobayashii TaxID=1917830 RepID=A0ABN6KD90_9LEPT|nr:hypothetical protein [Leptospira kobayashii]BDA78893.1 hypothetical protein LPTSP3_g18230 [Leptospira kobayashii]
MKRFAIFLLCVLFSEGCISFGEEKTGAKESAKLAGQPVFLEFKRLVAKSPKHLHLNLTVTNLSLSNIRSFSALLFAVDKQGLILIPETYKTPELICKLDRPLQPDTSVHCKEIIRSYAADIEKIELHSVAFGTEDGVRMLITKEDLKYISEYEE